MALWRNWIAHLTTNQEVTSSNLVRVTLNQAVALFIAQFAFLCAQNVPTKIPIKQIIDINKTKHFYIKHYIYSVFSDK